MDVCGGVGGREGVGRLLPACGRVFEGLGAESFMCVWGVVLSPLNNTHIDQASLKSHWSQCRTENSNLFCKEILRAFLMACESKTPGVMK